MRETGMFQRYHAMPGDELLSQSWFESKGVNNLIDVYLWAARLVIRRLTRPPVT